jgi:chorismate mutase
MSTPQDEDPVIRQFREQISDNDRAIVEAMNARLKLVARLKGALFVRAVRAIRDPGVA